MGMFKAIFGIVLVVAIFFVLFQVVPPIMANYSFGDDLKTIALVDSGNLQKTEDDIRLEVLRKAGEHNLPIDPKQVIVQRINTPGVTAIYVEADYDVKIVLPGYAFDMHFNPSSDNKGF